MQCRLRCSARVELALMRARLVLPLLRPTAPPLALGLVVAASLVAAETLALYPLKRVTSAEALGVVYLLGVLVVAIGWGFWLAAATTLASALALDYFHIPPIWSLTVYEREHVVTLGVFFVVALAASTLAGVARLRAAEIDQRRREVEASRDELGVLAELQASLRRVATLVARGVTPSAVLSAVAVELARCLGVYHHSVLFRYEPDGAGVVLAVGRRDPYDAVAEEASPPDVVEGLKVEGLKTEYLGERLSLEGESVAAKVFRTGRAARMDSHEDAPGLVAARFRALGIRTAVGAPIIVDGRLWGAAIVGSSRPETLPPDTEARVGDFADLVATAIANSQTRAELTASRARIVAVGDDARRRIERDLHDGVQQHLVTLALHARAAEASAPAELAELKDQLSCIASGLAEVSMELQEISRGIPPAILAKGGLRAAITALARRSPVPVHVDVAIPDQLPEPIEIAAYYLVAEALTNTAKHAHASTIRVQVDTADTDAGDPVLRVSVRDDGRGGADPHGGSGLVGLTDRVQALGGRLWLHSPPGAGTTLRAELPPSCARQARPQTRHGS
jgi:signal transduction histidine kinase